MGLEVGNHYLNSYGDSIHIVGNFFVNGEEMFVDHMNKKYYKDGVAVGDNKNWDIIWDIVC